MRAHSDWTNHSRNAYNCLYRGLNAANSNCHVRFSILHTEILQCSSRTHNTRPTALGKMAVAMTPSAKASTPCPIHTGCAARTAACAVGVAREDIVGIVVVITVSNAEVYVVEGSEMVVRSELVNVVVMIWPEEVTV